MHVRSPEPTRNEALPLLRTAPSPLPAVPLIPVQFLFSPLNKQALPPPPYPGPQQARLLTSPLPVSASPRPGAGPPPPRTGLGHDGMKWELGGPRVMTKENLYTSKKSSLSHHLRLISQDAHLTHRTAWVTCPCFTGGCSLPSTRHSPQGPLTPDPEGVLPLNPGSQSWVIKDFHRVPTPIPPSREGLNSPGLLQAALHGMIWMTLAFFMFAGRLPVLMFSFMIRTLVSFCSQEGHNPAVTTPTFLSEPLNPITARLSRAPVNLFLCLQTFPESWEIKPCARHTPPRGSLFSSQSSSSFFP